MHVLTQLRFGPKADTAVRFGSGRLDVNGPLEDK